MLDAIFLNIYRILLGVFLLVTVISLWLGITTIVSGASSFGKGGNTGISLGAEVDPNESVVDLNVQSSK